MAKKTFMMKMHQLRQKGHKIELLHMVNTWLIDEHVEEVFKDDPQKVIELMQTNGMLRKTKTIVPRSQKL